ncbi:unnamed protein product [Macrosiphum euphorbiae]|uniref:Envelope fusion protein n=1 Tax=Macrosiphum euphorbiae TaxID=13131 RepID=A0AAV0YDP8_9HEMI|nr:unnamed protein product [Macrosiphum euphorbiae]
MMTIVMLQVALAQPKPYQTSKLSQENGMYFENQGPLRLTNSDWKLIIYVKLDNFNQRTKETMYFYDKTIKLCDDLTIVYEGMFKTLCENFKIASISLEQEVTRKRVYMLQSIDETDTITRVRRGLVNLVGRIQKTLFGTLDDTDAETYDKQIEELQTSRNNLLKIVEKQTSILKATENTFKEATQMEGQINKLSTLYNRMATTVNQTVINLDIVEAKSNINEQINILNLIFQQLSFETDTICEVIIAAQGGIIHSSIISAMELRKQLKDISMNVPKGQSLPFDLNQISLYELSKMSKLNIIYINETLIFEIIIPLINSVDLTLFHVIPLPVVKNDHYMHIIPEYGYIAISKTHEYYLTLSFSQLLMCRQINMGTLCPETQPLRLGASELPCEVELFIKPSSIPSTCPIHYLYITRSIYHKLKYQNAWIYTIKTTDNVAISCENLDQAMNIQLSGIGILKLNEDCRGYTPQMVLTPNRHLNSTHYKDFISNIGITSNLTIPISIKKKISNVITHTNSVVKLTDLSQYSKSIDEIEQLIQEEKDKTTTRDITDFHTYMFYLIIIIASGIIIIKCKRKMSNNRSVNRVRRHLVSLQSAREMDEVTRL